MSATIRVATWNLARPKLNSWKHGPELLARIREVDADIWILTETNSKMVPESAGDAGAKYAGLASRPCAFHSAGESCVSIWSRFGIRREIETWNNGMAVCAEVDSPLGPMLVYGTLITFAGDPGTDGRSAKWEEHRKAAMENASDWMRLRKAHPRLAMCVAGDFNQNRDGTQWYCDEESEKTISAGLAGAHLRCVTEHNLRGPGFGFTRANIDHICISDGLEAAVGRDAYWMTGASDHNGVVATVSQKK